MAQAQDAVNGIVDWNDNGKYKQTEIYASKPIWQDNLLEQSWGFAIIEAQQ